MGEVAPSEVGRTAGERRREGEDDEGADPRQDKTEGRDPGPPVSVVVVTRNCADLLGALVDSMNRRLPESSELVVVDNASDDDPGAAAARWRGQGRFIELDANLGFGAATNRGVEAAANEAVVLLNPDTELLDDGLPRLAATALELGALAGPRLVNPDGSNQPSASGPPVGAWPWVGAVVPGALAPAAVAARTEPWRLDRRTRVAWLTGAAVAAPRTALLSLGPFDESFHLYSEDLDLGLRAAAGGVPSYFCPEVCRVLHHGGGSSRSLPPGDALRAAARNRREAVRRAFGEGRERRGRRAWLTGLALRAVAKRALGRDASRERAVLRASREADGEHRPR